MSEQPVIVSIDHIRKADLCAQGARKWFLSYGLSWTDFLENGIPAADLDLLRDGLADRVSAIARQEAENGQRK